eukprot:TRINITY_DN7557_c0_g3_i1.p1 TRINITY_DN7557_c0_g3~~TRINITY_DN7557_c0_g3_i1.p1  ORF type:complete len:107 (-),score=14.83 TRINITY_DN7557_c0_g3_i1:58-378(-)
MPKALISSRRQWLELPASVSHFAADWEQIAVVSLLIHFAVVADVPVVAVVAAVALVVVDCFFYESVYGKVLADAQQLFCRLQVVSYIHSHQARLLFYESASQSITS